MIVSVPGVVELRYQGWSGFVVAWPEGPCVHFDPPRGADLPRDRATVLLLSHGHPEHVRGAIAYLADPSPREATTVLAAPSVCRYLQRRHARPGDGFLPCTAGQTCSLPGLRVAVFPWIHMSLLPAGVGPALRHLGCLVSHPILALRIAWEGLFGPPFAPMLGFALLPQDGPGVLLYSEGMNRGLTVAEAERIGREFACEVLLFGVEPEDMDRLPDLVAAVGCPVAVPYQPHRRWREAFGMPLADLNGLAATLTARGIRVPLLDEGQATREGPGQSPPHGRTVDASVDRVSPGLPGVT